MEKSSTRVHLSLEQTSQVAVQAAASNGGRSSVDKHTSNNTMPAARMSVSRRKYSSRSEIAVDLSRVSITSVSSRPPTVMRKDGKLSHGKEETYNNVVKFVYSEAVEKAIRHFHKSSAFPPYSASTMYLSDPKIEILKLSELYTDLVTFRRTRKHNIEREQSFKAKDRLYCNRSNLLVSTPTYTVEDMACSLPDGFKLPKVKRHGGLADALAAFKVRKSGELSSAAHSNGVKLPNIHNSFKPSTSAGTEEKMHAVP